MYIDIDIDICNFFLKCPILNFVYKTQKNGSNSAGWHNSSLSNTIPGSSIFFIFFLFYTYIYV